MEQLTEVKTYNVDYKCDNLGCSGYLRPTGITFLSSPVRYPHQCNKCKAISTFQVKYPYIKYG